MTDGGCSFSCETLCQSYCQSSIEANKEISCPQCGYKSNIRSFQISPEKQPTWLQCSACGLDF